MWLCVEFVDVGASIPLQVRVASRDAVAVFLLDPEGRVRLIAAHRVAMEA